MNSLTNRLFEKLSNTGRSVEVNSELLSYLGKCGHSDEYKDLVDSLADPTSRTENLKRLVFKLYKDHKLKDLDFFRYLVWSGQKDLCKLIGYGDKQIDKLMKDKPTQKPNLNTADTDGSNLMEVEPDTGMVILKLHEL